jgi:winged helix-turn-helix protein DUF2582
MVVMKEEIGLTAGMVWRTLNTKGELSLAQLKREVNGKTPLFDWAVGWLAREHKIRITREKCSFRVCLKRTQAHSAGAS